MAFIGVDDMMGECLLGRAQGSHVQDLTHDDYELYLSCLPRDEPRGLHHLIRHVPGELHMK